MTENAQKSDSTWNYYWINIPNSFLFDNSTPNSHISHSVLEDALLQVHVHILFIKHTLLDQLVPLHLRSNPLFNLPPIQPRHVWSVLHIYNPKPTLPRHSPKCQKDHCHSLPPPNPTLRQTQLKKHRGPIAHIKLIMQLAIRVRRPKTPNLGLQAQPMSAQVTSFRSYFEREKKGVVC